MFEVGLKSRQEMIHINQNIDKYVQYFHSHLIYGYKTTMGLSESFTIMDYKLCSYSLSRKIVNTASSVSNITTDDKLTACKILQNVCYHTRVMQQSLRKLQMYNKLLQVRSVCTSFPNIFFISVILHILLCISKL